MTPTIEPAHLVLRFETELKFAVTFKNESRMLNGNAEFTLWYDDKESMATNLVVVEAKRRGSIGLAAGQLLAYMGKYAPSWAVVLQRSHVIGVVHQTRKQEKRRNAVVYGISTDGDEFRFWRIDNDSVVGTLKCYLCVGAQDITGHAKQYVRLE